MTIEHQRLGQKVASHNNFTNNCIGPNEHKDKIIPLLRLQTFCLSLSLSSKLGSSNGDTQKANYKPIFWQHASNGTKSTIQGFVEAKNCTYIPGPRTVARHAEKC